MEIVVVYWFTTYCASHCMETLCCWWKWGSPMELLEKYFGVPCMGGWSAVVSFIEAGANAGDCSQVPTVSSTTSWLSSVPLREVQPCRHWAQKKGQGVEMCRHLASAGPPKLPQFRFIHAGAWPSSVSVPGCAQAGAVLRRRPLCLLQGELECGGRHVPLREAVGELWSCYRRLGKEAFPLN